jgi:hypothetical protein
MYLLGLSFLLILLPKFALYMYFYLRPTTIMKELRMCSIILLSETDNNNAGIENVFYNTFI